MRLEGQRQPKADEDDADILHRVIGEQPLEIVLHQRIEHAHHGGDAAKREHDDAPPPGRRRRQIEHDADEAVDRDLGHHAAHQRRDMARRRRMRERQPDMQRHEAGLGAGADQRQDQGKRAEHRGRVRRAHLREGVEPVGPREQAEGEQQSQRAEARHDQIDVAGADIVGHAMVRHDQRPRRQRHELPGDEKSEGVVGQHDERHAGEKGRIERQHALRRRLVAAIAEREQACGSRRRDRRRRGRTRRARRGGNARRATAGQAAASGFRRARRRADASAPRQATWP